MTRLDTGHVSPPPPFSHVFFFFLSFPPSLAKYTTYDSPGGRGEWYFHDRHLSFHFPKNNGGRRQERESETWHMHIPDLGYTYLLTRSQKLHFFSLGNVSYISFRSFEKEKRINFTDFWWVFFFESRRKWTVFFCFFFPNSIQLDSVRFDG